MKKVIKSRIFLVIICGIIFTSLGVYATNTYKATDIVYNASDGTNQDIATVLNDLYLMKTELENIKNQGNAVSSDIAEGKTAVVQGKIIVGTGKINKPDFSFAIKISGTTTDKGGGRYSQSQTATVNYISKTDSFIYSNVKVSNNATSASASGSCSISNFSGYINDTYDFSFDIKISGTTTDKGGGKYNQSGSAQIVYDYKNNNFIYSNVKVSNNATSASAGGSCSISNFELN